MLPPNETEMQVIAQELCRIKGIDPYELFEFESGKGPKKFYAYELQLENHVRPLMQVLEAVNRVMVGKAVMD